MYASSGSSITLQCKHIPHAKLIPGEKMERPRTASERMDGRSVIDGTRGRRYDAASRGERGALVVRPITTECRKAATEKEEEEKRGRER